MSFIRQYVVPLIAVAMFLVALVVVSARTFLPSGLSGPAPIEEVNLTAPATSADNPANTGVN